jgi:hypothetical protein
MGILLGNWQKNFWVSVYRQPPRKKKSPAWGDDSNFFRFRRVRFARFLDFELPFAVVAPLNAEFAHLRLRLQTLRATFPSFGGRYRPKTSLPALVDLKFVYRLLRQLLQAERF